MSRRLSPCTDRSSKTIEFAYDESHESRQDPPSTSTSPSSDEESACDNHLETGMRRHMRMLRFHERQKEIRHQELADGNKKQQHTEPGKWQLVVVITIAVWLAELAGINLLREFLRRGDWLSESAIIFLVLSAELFVLFYTCIEVLIPILTITFNGEKYGFAPFMVYRVKWVHKYDNFLVQILSSAVDFLEEGLRLFDTPTTNRRHQSSSPARTSVIMSIKRQVKVPYLSRYKSWLRQEQLALLTYKGNHVDCEFVSRLSASFNLLRGFNHQTRQQATRQTFMGIDMGCIELERNGILDSSLDGARHGRGTINGHGTAEEDEDFEVGSKSVLHTSNLKFPSSYFLEMWLSSFERQDMNKKLNVMLLSPEIVTFEEGGNEDVMKEELLPSKWKVWMLNNFGFYVAILWSIHFFSPHYFDAWNVNDTSGIWLKLLDITVVNFVGFYFTTPFFELVFCNWLRRTPEGIEQQRSNQEPWRTLNDGFRWYWLKVAVLVGMYGGLLAWRAAKGDWSCC